MIKVYVLCFEDVCNQSWAPILFSWIADSDPDNLFILLSRVHTASVKHGDLLLRLLLHLMLGINYYVCPDSEHQVPHVWQLVTRGRRLVTGYIYQNGTCLI